MDDPRLSDKERARRILGAMRRLDRAGKRRSVAVPWVWLAALVLLAAIVAVLAVGRERYGRLWQHLTRPDSVPGAQP